MVAGFSNFGKRGVDVFAPGVAIYSSVPGSKYSEQNGTSMASPAVAGVAALIRSYFPQLSSHQVKDIILQSVVKFPDTKVKVNGKLVDFSSLSTTGGVVNAYNAIKLAIEQTQ